MTGLPVLFAFTTPGHVVQGLMVMLVLSVLLSRNNFRLLKKEFFVVVFSVFFWLTVVDAEMIFDCYGVPKENPLSHRALSHSPFFGAFATYLWAMLFTFREQDRRKTYALWGISAASHLFHVLADLACQGRGVMLLWPLSTERLLFPKAFQIVPDYSATSVSGVMGAFSVELAALAFLAFVLHGALTVTSKSFLRRISTYQKFVKGYAKV